METTILTKVALYVAEKVSDEFIRIGIDLSLHELTKKQFVTRLFNTINSTLIDYDKNHMIEDKGDKYGFYKSQIIVDKLLNFSFFHEFDTYDFYYCLNNNEKIIPPTLNEISMFLALFHEKIMKDKFLKKLEIEETYKEKIFEILQKVEEIRNKVDINSDIKAIRNKFFNRVPYYDKEELIGRNDLLKELDFSLKKEFIVVAVSGTGGIGKTTLVLAYINNPIYTMDLDNIIWVNVVSNIKSSFIQQFYEFRNNFEYNPNESIDGNFTKIINYLRRFKGNNLLIIDNVNNIEEIYNTINEINIIRWKIVLITRTKLDLFPSILVSELSLESALQLFYHHYTKDRNDDLVIKIIEKIELHTLLIELIAKVGNYNHLLSLEELTSLIINTKFTAKELNINIYIKDIAKTGRLYDYLITIFRLDNLSDTERKYLSLFSILPENPIDFTDIVDLFFDSEKSSKEEFIDTINILVVKGWIMKYNKLYRSHMLIQTLLRDMLPLNTDYISRYVEKIKFKLFITPGENPILKAKYVDYGTCLIKYLNHEELELATIANNISVILKFIGDIKRSEEYINKSFKIRASLLNSNDSELAQSYCNKGSVELELGNIREGFRLIDKSKDIYSKLGENFLGELAICFDGLSRAYEMQGNFETALSCTKRSLELRLICLPSYHPLLAYSYNNVSVSYRMLENYFEALMYAQKDLEISESIYNEYHPDLAISYDNISIIYEGLKDYTKALFYTHKALKIRQIIYKTPHVDLAKSFNTTGIILNKLKKYKISLEYKLKAIQILEKLKSTNSIYLITMYQNVAVSYFNLHDNANAKMYIENAEKLITQNELQNYFTNTDFYLIQQIIQASI